MRRNVLKINGYIFGLNESIQDVFMNYIQDNDLYFVGKTYKKNPLDIDMMHDAVRIDGYIFSDNSDSDYLYYVEDYFYESMDKNKYYFVGTIDKFNTEIKL